MEEQERKTPGAVAGTGGKDQGQHEAAAHGNATGDSLAPDATRRDPECLLTFLRGWSPDGPWWPTAIPREGGGTETRTFTDLAALHEWARGLVGVKNLYFHVNDLSPGARSKGKKADVTRIRGLHVDVDARVPDGGWPDSEPTPERLAELVAYSEAERRRIWTMFEDWEVNGKKLTIPRPTAVIDSGGGYQGFWLLAEGEEVAPEEAEALNVVIAGLLDGDRPTVDVSRVMRLPGTVNLPSQKKRWRGRVDAPTRLVWADWSRRFRLADFPAPPERRTDVRTGGARAVSLPKDLPDLMGAEDPRLLNPSALERAIIMHGLPPDDPGRFPSRSEAMFHVLCARVRAGVPDDVLAGLILDPSLGISGHVLGQPRPEQYAARQIQRAHDDVEANTDPLLRVMNERHALLTHEGKKATIGEFVYELLNPEERDPSRQRWRWVLYFQSAADFRLTFDNRAVVVGRDKDGNDVKKPLGDAWLKWAGRREYRSLTFDPGAGEVVGDKLNLWRGFAVKPAPGDWSLMQAHILEVLADGDPEVAQYIVKWLALAVQRPQQPAGVALVFRGGRGSGKGIFAHYARAMFGQHGFYIPGAAALGAKFNAHIRDTVLLYADEVKWNGNKNAESLLQAMVTEPELLVEGKYKDAALAKNRLHLIITSNEDWVVPAAIDERRFAVFRPSDKMQGPGNKPYFDAIGAQMDGSGLAAMLHDLLAMDLTGFNVREMPESRELSQQKMEGLTGPDRIDMEILMSGIAPGGTRPYMQVGKQRHQRQEPVVSIPAVVQWAVDRRIVREAPSTQRMGRALERIGAERDRFYDARGVQFWAWALPPLAEARATWAKKLGLSGIDWPEDDGWTCSPSQD